MKIPKYILHPTLIIACGGLLMYMLWLRTPSAAEIITDQNDQESIVDKNGSLLLNGLYQVTELLPKGYLVINNLEGTWQINNPRFKTLSAKKAENLQDFFVGMFVKIPDPKGKKEINLPLELYHPNCFSNNPQIRASTNQCPVLLQP